MPELGDLRFIIITNEPELAREAEAASVQCVMLDLERLGKVERQRHIDAHVSDHAWSDLPRLRATLSRAELMVRLNPWHAGSREEIARALQGGADRLMLPMIRAVGHLEAFLEVVAGRARVTPLVETMESMRAIDDIAALPVDDVYIGLNDLHLSLGLVHVFEPLALGHVERMADAIRARGRGFGFGGIAPLGEGEIPSALVLAEHARLGSSQVILSRHFRRAAAERGLGRSRFLAEETERLRVCYRALLDRSPAAAVSDHERLGAIVRAVAARLHAG